MLTARTKLVGIIGYPVEHSISPAIHNAAFSAEQLDYAYVPLPVEPAHLKDAIQGLKAMGFAGANVTIPHKVAVMEYLDEIDDTAKIIGAVNTIVIRGSRCIGYNTDAAGFVKSLQAKNVELQNKHAVLLGAGGAARAVVCGLLDNGVAQITVAARNAVKAIEFAASFNKENVTATAWDSNTAESAIKLAGILVNCTPLGMYPDIDAQPPVQWNLLNHQAVVCDLIYNPDMTAFLKQAASLGHRIVNGEGMLVEQGALAFELWTAKRAPRSAMYAAFTNAR